jgi:hypothetical protein
MDGLNRSHSSSSNIIKSMGLQMSESFVNVRPVRVADFAAVLYSNFS